MALTTDQITAVINFANDIQRAHAMTLHICRFNPERTMKIEAWRRLKRG